MASYDVNSVIHELDLIKNNSAMQSCFGLVFHGEIDFATLQLKLKFLETFLLCARKWRNSGLDFESDDGEVVSLEPFSSSIEVAINTHGSNVHSLRLELEERERLGRWIGDGYVRNVLSNFWENISSFDQQIIVLYQKLPRFIYSSQSNSCMRDDELVGFIDYILQNLVDLLCHRQFVECMEVYNTALYGQIEALGDKLTFLKNFIRFAKLRAVRHKQFETLLTAAQFAALNAAWVSCACLFYYRANKEVHLSQMCSLISDLLQKIKPVYPASEFYIQVLRASESPSHLHAEKMDKRVVQDFNDSLIIFLWELLCGASILVSVQEQMRRFYEGLRFLRSILREPHEQMDVLTEEIVAVIEEAGIVICSLFAREVDVDSEVVTDSPDCCAMLVSINSNIEHIKAKISSLSATGSVPSYHCFKAQEIRKTSRLMPSKGKIPVTHEVVVGFDKEAEILTGRLVGGSRQLEIIPIVGMPGLGKTTLAKKVYNNPSSFHHFHIRLWGTVSQVYNKKKLLIQILCSDGKQSRTNEELNTLDEHELQEKLYKKLKRNTYLVVFDDVWDIKVWNELSFSFPNDNNRSRIFFTSRISNLASEVEIARVPHNVNQLNDRESWELLQKKVFGIEGDCPQALRETGMKIAKICNGLPLTIVVVAGILGTTEYDDWDEVAESLTSTILYDTDLCKNILEMSYMHLPEYLKPCFLYFGVFLEDQEIKSKKLMWLWMAEGLVRNTDPKRSEDLAEEYMLDLIGRNLVMVAKQRSGGGVKACQIHDLLHGFCKTKAKEENFLQVLHGYDELSTFNVPPNLKRLSILSDVDHFKRARVFSPHISSLLFKQIEESEWTAALMADMPFISCIYKGLRVLDLEQIFLWCNFPWEVESLVELRYLGVQCVMKSVPPSIDSLSNLETFRVIAFDIVSLPQTIWNMTKLRHLYIWEYRGCSLPSENLENDSDLLCLDTFSTLVVPQDQSAEDITRKIRNVRQLKIEFSAPEESSSTTGDCNLSGLQSLESLTVSATPFLLNPDAFSFPLNLKKLVIAALRLPWSKIQMVEKLPNLEVLKLLYYSFEGEKWDLTEGGFLNLRFLSLDVLGIVEWTDSGSDDYFPSLQTLLLSELSYLQSLPSCLQRISNLEVIKVRICNDSVRDLARKIEEEQQSYGNENLKVLIYNRDESTDG